MKAQKIPVLLVWLTLVFLANRLWADTPLDENFDSASGSGISSRIIGDWQFRLLDINGDDDNGGRDFVDIIDSEEPGVTALASGGDNALTLIGTTNVAFSAQIRSKDADPFRLVSFAIDGDDQNYIVAGYRAGLPVAGATQTFSAPILVETLVVLTNDMFWSIDEFRIYRQDLVADVYIFIDDINVSNPVSTSFNPVISNLDGDSTTYVEGSAPVRMDTGTAATVSDTDSANFFGGAIVVGVTANGFALQDALGIEHEGTGAGQVGISGNNITYGGTTVATFTGGSNFEDLFINLNNSASKTAAQGIIRALTYRNTSTGLPTTDTRTVAIRLYDGDGGYIAVSVSVAVELNNFPPVIIVTGNTNSFLEGINEPSVSIPVDPGLTVDDTDNTTLLSATVAIIRNFANDEDLLLFTNSPSTMGNISGSYDPDTGVLSLASARGLATLAEWTAALRSVAYQNYSDDPSTLLRTFRLVADDGSDASEGATTYMTVDAFNDAPVNSIPGDTQNVLFGLPFTFSPASSNAISVADMDARANSIQMSLTASTGVVSLASISGLVFLTGDGTNDEIVGFTGSIANINTALDGATYTPPSGFIGSASITVFTSDLGNSGPGGFLVDSDVIALNIAPPPPSITSVSATNANGVYIIGETVGIEVTFDQSVTVDTSGGVPALGLNVGVTNQYPAPYATGSGSSTLLFLYTVQAGHSSVDLDYAFTNALVLNGGAISNVVAANAVLVIPGIGESGSLDSNSDIVIDGVLPIVTSIALGGSSPTSATNVTFTVAFSEPISGLDITDFALTTSGTATGLVQNVSQVGPTSQNFSVTLSEVAGDGTLRLDLNDSGTGIADLATQSIAVGYTNGASYVIDTTSPLAPVFTDVSDDTGTPGDQLTADTTVILHGTAESNALVTITRVGTGIIGSTNADLAGTWSFDYRGTLLTVGTNVFTAVATDASTNVSPASLSFEVVVFDTILPNVDAITRSDASPTAASNVTFMVAFSEPVGGVDVADFTLVATGSATGTVQNVSQVGPFPQDYEVTIVQVSGDGTLRLDLNDTGTGITDLAGQSITNGFSSGEVYEIDSVVPAAPVFTGISEDTGVDGDFVTVDPTLILSGTAESNILVTLTLVGTGTIGSTNADISGDWSFDYTGTSLPEGTNVFTAIATDGAGNVSTASANFTVVINSDFSLTLLSTPTVYAKDQPPVKLDTSAVLNPGERTHFDGGQLSATIISNAAPEDALSVYDRGTGTNQIGVVSNTVSFGSLVFAQLTPATNATSPLLISFNTNSTPAAVEALVRELAFVTSSRDTTARIVELVLMDSLGSTTPPARKTIVMNKAAKEKFVTNPFPEFVGVFNGLVLQPDNIVPEESGYFTLKVSSKLAYSGKLTIGGRRVSISGQINTNGQVSTFTSRQKWGVDLQLVEGTDQVVGRVTSYIGGGWTSDLFGYRNGFSKTDPAGELARSYTLRLPESTDPGVAILGHGHASIVVKTTGQAKLKGLLADGQKWSQSSYLSTNGYCPIYVSLDRKLGEIIGWVQFSDTASNAVSGTLTWIKPAGDPFLTNGIAAELDATGSRYLAPGSTDNMLNWTNGLVTATLGNLPDALTNSVTLIARGKLTDEGGSFTKLKFSLSKKTGLFKGSFTHPATSRSAKHYGALLQDREDGAGFFLGTNVGGILRLDEAP